jgi:SAM-dependent methyltransferase
MVPLDPERERSELAAYLGDAYDQRRLERYDEQLEEEFRRIGDEAALYRTSEGYLYNLTAFAMTGTKIPYLEELMSHVPPGTKLLDYGCGIGSDGLLLLEAGYDVSFADFDNPSTRYLRWRLERRSRAAPIYDLDRERPPNDFDLAYSFDVIEHVDDPFDFLRRLERHARRVCVNFLEPEPGETELHRELPVSRLLAHAAERRIISYKLLHGRSHLVLYGSDPAGPVGRLRSRALLWRERAAVGGAGR